MLPGAPSGDGQCRKQMSHPLECGSQWDLNLYFYGSLVRFKVGRLALLALCCVCMLLCVVVNAIGCMYVVNLLCVCLSWCPVHSLILHVPLDSCSRFLHPVCSGGGQMDGWIRNHLLLKFFLPCVSRLRRARGTVETSEPVWPLLSDLSLTEWRRGPMKFVPLR